MVGIGNYVILENIEGEDEKTKEGQFLIVNQKKFSEVKNQRVVAELSKELFNELKLTDKYTSLEEIIYEVKAKDISPKYLKEKEELLHRLMIEGNLLIWRKAFGNLPNLYGADSYVLFPFLTEILEKRNLYGIFSQIANNPVSNEKLNFYEKQQAYILNEKYRLINFEVRDGKIVWVPNRLASLYEFNRILKRILEMEEAPKELLEIVKKQEQLLNEERRKSEEIELRFVFR
ncbi:MAG: hypothetical protein QXQ77_02095 [Candidatus Aenigmatarchaeota archaeon]